VQRFLILSVLHPLHRLTPSERAHSIKITAAGFFHIRMLGHTKIESTIRYLDIDDAIEFAEKIDV
jgi:hypothetical protein